MFIAMESRNRALYVAMAKATYSRSDSDELRGIISCLRRKKDERTADRPFLIPSGAAAADNDDAWKRVNNFEF